VSGRARIGAGLLLALPALLFASDCAGGAPGGGGSPGGAPVAATPEPAAAPGQPFTLKVGERVAVDSGKVSVAFLAVPEDSRCPKGEQCIWAGNARISLEVRVGDAEPRAVSLETNRGEPEADLEGYVLRLEGLAPQPVTGRAIAPENYSVTLSLRPR